MTTHHSLPPRWIGAALLSAGASSAVVMIFPQVALVVCALLLIAALLILPFFALGVSFQPAPGFKKEEVVNDASNDTGAGSFSEGEQ